MEAGSPVTGVAFSRDGTRIGSGSTDKAVRLWNARKGQLIVSTKGHEDGVSCVAFSPDATQVVSGSRDMTLRLWDAKTGDPFRTSIRVLPE